MNAFLKGTAAIAVSVFLTTAAMAEEVNFGIISTESQQNLRPKWEPLLADLSKATGLDVKPFFASDYSGVIEGMRFGKVQMAWYGNKSAMEAVDRANGEVFASVIDKDGNPGYWSMLIVRKDSDLKSVEDVIKRGKDLSYGAGDASSAWGTAVRGDSLWAGNKGEPKTLFKAVRISNHETNLLSVLNKQVDVAVNNTENFERYRINTGKNAYDEVRVLWKSPLIPADPLVYRKDLSPEMKKKIQTFFVNYGKGTDAAREKQTLAALTYQGFRVSSDAQLVPIRQIELAKEKAKIESDSTLAAADKEKKLADVSRRLAELDRAVSTQ